MTATPARARPARWAGTDSVAPSGWLDALGWGYTSGALRALGHTFAVRATDRRVGEFLGDALGAFAIRGAPGTFYSLLDRGPEPEPYVLYRGDRRIMRHASPAPLLGHLLWDINRRAVASSPELVLVHAAAAERDGVGVVLPAAMDAGKTTLVAGLVRAGFGYLTDEAAAVDPRTLRVRAYPKPLSIDRGSWPVLADLKPQVAAVVRPYLRQQWQVPATAIRAGAVAAGAAPRLVIAPRYVARAETVLEPVSRAELLMELVTLTFGFRDAADRNLAVLAALLRRCECFRLTVGNLADACALVQCAVDAAGPPAARAAPPTQGREDR